MKMFRLSTLVAGLAMFASMSSAAVVFQDNFNSENGGSPVLNLPTLSQWTVDRDSIDLIGTGYFDFYPGNGLYLDMDGSTGANSNGQITTLLSFGAGTYTVSFDLGNNPGGGNNSLTVSLGNWTETFFTTGYPALTTITRTFSTAGGQLRFSQGGPSDQQGSILDNVSLQTTSEAPEPSTFALIGLGAAALGFFRKRSA